MAVTLEDFHFFTLVYASWEEYNHGNHLGPQWYCTMGMDIWDRSGIAQWAWRRFTTCGRERCMEV